MNGQDENGGVMYSQANDNAARAIAYLGPYLFWGTVGVLTSGIFLLA